MIFLVTGLMRSGTSAMAELLHRSGIDMGSAIISPIPGCDMPFEWEEAWASESLYLGNPLHCAYFEHRAKTKRSEHWGFKSPFAMSHVEQLRETAKTKGERLFVIQMDRDYTETINSIMRAPISDDLKRELSNRQLALSVAATRFRPDLLVPNHELRENPGGVLGQVAMATGIPYNCGTGG